MIELLISILMGILLGYNIGYRRGKKITKKTIDKTMPLAFKEKSLVKGYCVICNHRKNVSESER